MAKASLGRLEPVAVREVWPNEESDFTPWLAEPENLGVLADALGMSLEFVAREEKVGPYSADILCRDPNDQTKVVVENQLGQTDHDHLGKLLTYAAHFNARVLVWVARTFTDQHRAALDWLNEVSETSTRFFGLEIELWRIGDSVPAPKFNVVARPNDWTRGRNGCGGAHGHAANATRFLGGIHGIRLPEGHDRQEDPRTQASQLAGDGWSRPRGLLPVRRDVHMVRGGRSRTEGGAPNHRRGQQPLL